MGGGGPTTTPTTKTPGKPAAPAQPAFQRIDPFMPGMDQMLAQQLAMGFGGNPADFLKQFAQTYSPMQLPNSPVTLAPTTPTPTNPTNPTQKTRAERDGKVFALDWKRDAYNRGG